MARELKQYDPELKDKILAKLIILNKAGYTHRKTKFYPTPLDSVNFPPFPALLRSLGVDYVGY